MRAIAVLVVAALTGCAGGVPGCGAFGSAGEVRFAKAVKGTNYCVVTATYTHRDSTPASVHLRVLAADSAGNTVTEQPLLFRRMDPGATQTVEIVDDRICDVTSVSVQMAEKITSTASLIPLPGRPVCGVEGYRAQLQ